MMTEKLYYADSHMYSFSATVLSCAEDKGRFAVILDRTAFFPEGGGQSSDTGVIGDVRVLDVQEVSEEIIHYTDAPINVGTTVQCELDADERFRKMQNHSGEHIVSGFVSRLFGYDNVGFHLGNFDVTVDYNGELSREDLDKIEDLSNQAVYDNLPIKTEFPDSERLSSMTYRAKLELTENVRIVTIGDVDVCACCAPHVSYTGEIGAIKILDFERYKGGIRLHMLCGRDAMEDYRDKYSSVKRISSVLCVPQNQTADAVDTIVSQAKDKDYLICGLREKLAFASMQASSMVGEHLCFFADSDCDMDSVRKAVNVGMEKCAVVCAGFITSEQGFKYCIGSKNVDLRQNSRMINTAIDGRGGGQASMIQGTANAEKEKIIAFFTTWITE